MFQTIINFSTLLLASLVVGTMFGIWLGFNPSDLSPRAYVEQQQHAIRALNVTMPVLGGITALLTLTAAFLARQNPTAMICLLLGFVCFAMAGIVTRFLNQPINAIVITWPPDAPPSNWTELRDAWWKWHIVRTAIGVVGLCLLIAANLIVGSDRVGH
jgi:uncharacterized membrane protein